MGCLHSLTVPGGEHEEIPINSAPMMGCLRQSSRRMGWLALVPTSGGSVLIRSLLSFFIMKKEEGPTEHRAGSGSVLSTSRIR